MNVTRRDYDGIANHAINGRLDDWYRVSDNLHLTPAAARAEARRVKVAVERRTDLKIATRIVETLSSVLTQNYDAFIVEVKVA